MRPSALALGTGAVGGAVFHVIGIPLAWMLGPMMVNMAAGLGGARIGVSDRLRAVILIGLGLYLGSAFHPGLLDQVAAWPWSVAGMLGFVPVSVAVGTWYLRRVARLDPATALFAAIPGGFSAMVALGAAAGGDDRRIALIHALRIIVVVTVTTAAVAAQGGAGVDGTIASTAPAATRPTVEGIQLALLIVAGGLGFGLARRVRLPAPHVTGPMAVSGTLYMTGIVTTALPPAVLHVGLLVLGASIGARFASFRLGDILHTGRHALVLVALTLSLAVLAGAAVAAFLGLPWVAVVVAFAPGGVAEMSVLAISLGLDPVYVAVHHVTRIMVLLAVAPLLGRLLSKRSPPG